MLESCKQSTARYSAVAYFITRHPDLLGLVVRIALGLVVVPVMVCVEVNETNRIRIERVPLVALIWLREREHKRKDPNKSGR